MVARGEIVDLKTAYALDAGLKGEQKRTRQGI